MAPQPSPQKGTGPPRAPRVVRGFAFFGTGVEDMTMDLHRSDLNGEFNLGNTLIRTLRKGYGARFAEGCRDDEKLRDALCKMDDPSRGTLIHDQLLGKVSRFVGRLLDTAVRQSGG